MGYSSLMPSWAYLERHHHRAPDKSYAPAKRKRCTTRQPSHFQTILAEPLHSRALVNSTYPTQRIAHMPPQSRHTKHQGRPAG